MLAAAEAASEFWPASPDREASSVVTAGGRAAELIPVLSGTDRNPFKTDRSGFGKLRGQGRLVAVAVAELAMAGGRGLATPCGVGVKDRGRPAKAGDREFGLPAEAVTGAAGKARLAKGVEADTKASLGAEVAHGVERPGGAIAVGSPEKAGGRGVEGVPCAGAAGSEWDLVRAEAGGVNGGGEWAEEEEEERTCPGKTGRTGVALLPGRLGGGASADEWLSALADEGGRAEGAAG